MTAAASEQAGAATVKLLLDKGADPNAEDSDGERPLDWALYRSDRAKIEVLEKFGATRGKGPRQKIYPPPEAGGIADPRVSVDRAVNLLLPTAPVAFQKRGCISCHNNSLPAMTIALARKKGFVINEEQAKKELGFAIATEKPFFEAMRMGSSIGGGSSRVGGTTSGERSW
jgi:hypothetical protein